MYEYAQFVAEVRKYTRSGVALKEAELKMEQAQKEAEQAQKEILQANLKIKFLTYQVQGKTLEEISELLQMPIEQLRNL